MASDLKLRWIVEDNLEASACVFGYVRKKHSPSNDHVFVGAVGYSRTGEDVTGEVLEECQLAAERWIDAELKYQGLRDAYDDLCPGLHDSRQLARALCDSGGGPPFNLSGVFSLRSLKFLCEFFDSRPQVPVDAVILCACGEDAKHIGYPDGARSEAICECDACLARRCADESCTLSGSVLYEWRMLCPSCGHDDGFKVSILAEARLYADRTEEDGSHEWGDESHCRCSCGWHGDVGAARRAAERLIRKSGWRSPEDERRRSA